MFEMYLVQVPRILGLAFLTLAIAACGGPAHAPAPAGSSPANVLPPSTTLAPNVTVTGLFLEPRLTPPDATRSLGALPMPFAPWDGTSTMIYDVIAGTEVNLGRGSIGRFSPDSTRMVWISRPTDSFNNGEARIIDLRTMEQRSLGPGRLAIFADNDHVEIARPDSNESEIVDLRSGALTPVVGLPNFQPSYVTTTNDGQELRQTVLDPNDQARSRFTLTGAANGRVLLEFEAWHAKPAGSGALVVATVAQAAPGDIPTPTITGAVPQTTNIFLVDIASGRATFVATSSAHGPNWPLIADTRYVVWTEDYCGPGGRTRIFDRRSGDITEINASLWLDAFTPGGLIAAGAFGAKELIDPETLEYAAVLPAGGDTSWSPDYRYASMEIIGHGGLCG